MLSKTKQICEKYNGWSSIVKHMLSASKSEKCDLEEFSEKINFANKNGYNKNDLYDKLLIVVEKAKNCEQIVKNLCNTFQETGEKMECKENKMQWNLEQFKSFMIKLNDLECSFPQEKYLSTKLLEIVEFEKIAKDCLEKKTLDCSLLKKYLDYCSKLNFDLGSLHSNLKMQYDQSLWISDVNNAISNPKSLNLSIIHNLLVKATGLSSDNLIITKKIMNLQELYCIAKIWDKKAEDYFQNK